MANGFSVKSVETAINKIMNDSELSEALNNNDWDSFYDKISRNVGDSWWSVMYYTAALIEAGIDLYGITKIPENFLGKLPIKGLDKFIVPSSVSTISKNAFSNCKLKEIIIPTSVIKIGDWCFARSENLEKVIIPDSVTDVGAGAFYMCNSIKKIRIPKDCKSDIRVGHFKGCDSLEELELPERYKLGLYCPKFNPKYLPHVKVTFY